MIVRSTRPLLLTPPAGPLVALVDIKAAVGAPPASDDLLLTALEVAVVDLLDGYDGVLGRCLMTQSWSFAVDGWGGREIDLPFPDVTSAIVTYDDENGARQTMPEANYEIIEAACGAMILIKDEVALPFLGGDAAFPVQITCEAGYGDADDVPKAIGQAIKLKVAYWYDMELRGAAYDANAAPSSFNALIAPYRWAQV